MASIGVVREWTAEAVQEMEQHSASIAEKLGITIEPLPHDKKRHRDTAHRQAYALQATANFLKQIDEKLAAQTAPKNSKGGSSK